MPYLMLSLKRLRGGLMGFIRSCLSICCIRCFTYSSIKRSFSALLAPLWSVGMDNSSAWGPRGPRGQKQGWRLAVIGGDWRRLAAIGDDWRRMAAIGGDWRRLAAIGGDWLDPTFSFTTAAAHLPSFSFTLIGRA